MSEKDWYRNSVTGDRAYREERDGVDVIVYDRPEQDISQKFNEHLWVPDKDARPLSTMNLAQVAFAADSALCRALGQFQKDGDWLMLREKTRIAWMKKGPQDSFVRRTLYGYITEAIRHLAEPGYQPVPVESLVKLVDALRDMGEQDKPGKAVRELLAIIDNNDEEKTLAEGSDAEKS